MTLGGSIVLHFVDCRILLDLILMFPLSSRDLGSSPSKKTGMLLKKTKYKDASSSLFGFIVTAKLNLCELGVTR